ncbi:MAG: hypothetical protein R3F49_17935 [Planctomycetota bacterium]
MIPRNAPTHASAPMLDPILDRSGDGVRARAPRAPRAPRSSLVRVAAALTCVLLAAACSSDGNGKREMTKEEQLGLYFENALWYLQMGDLDRAQFQAEKALEIDPKNDRFELIYARTNVMRGTTASISLALQIFEARPDLEDYRWQMTYGAALERKGVLFDEAARGVRTGERATTASNRDARAKELQEDALELWREARARFERSNELFTGQTETLNGLVRTSALLGDFQASIDWSTALVENIRESQFLSRSQLEAPDISADREAQLRESLRKNRDFEVQVRLHKATLLRRIGKPADAVRELDEVIALEPDIAQTHSLRGQLLMQTGEYVKARAALQRFLDLTDLPFDHPDVRKAFDLQDECERHERAR